MASVKKKVIVKKDVTTKEKKKTASTKSLTTKKSRPTRKKAAAKKALPKKPAGYSTTESGILIPDKSAPPVPASKLRSGFKNAKKEINSVIEEIVSTMTDNYVISEIELSASFSADGKFLGFGVGGAASIKIKIKPEG